VVVTSEDYHLSSKNPYPAGIEDCYAGLKWVHDNTGMDRERDGEMESGGGREEREIRE
jgi:acetyl esterase/lipase